MLTPKQIEARKKGIGASEAATVMGLNPNKSPYQLWLEKTGRAEPDDLSDYHKYPQVYWGNMHEEQIAQHYALEMDCKVRRVNETQVHKEFPFVLCHLDRKIEGMKKALECKFAMYAKDQWGESHSDIVPLSYNVQVQYQMLVTGYVEADLAVLISGYDFRVYHFKRNEPLIAKILEEVKAFWKCVETDTPPELRDRTDAALMYKLSNGNLLDAEEPIVKVVEEFREVRATVKELEAKREMLADKLTLFIKDAEGVRYGKEVLATWKPTVKGNRVLKVTEARL